jgi:hypothetical protein
LKFHFAITGHGEASTEVEFVEWLQDMINEYNRAYTSNTIPKFNSYHVLVREDVIQD